ncbi:hypothetical protein DLD77_02815 [Chitinophaga alhagiae]|uniref:Uncharacterized protein n=1 Tax=Chitinophaga alhagiae TaxID=2203219 RepID=A0ABM6W9R3_9BACT|nr:hypothetical protein DLD77_02815 [Chitinophaga alhagiae]
MVNIKWIKFIQHVRFSDAYLGKTLLLARNFSLKIVKKGQSGKTEVVNLRLTASPVGKRNKTL